MMVDMTEAASIDWEKVEITPAHAERVHHPYSPSKLQNLEACPQFTQENVRSEASDRGTAQHEAMETGIDDNLSDDESLAVLKCRNYVAFFKRAYAEDLGGFEEVQEVYLPVDDEDTSAGYLDLAILSRTHFCAELFDYKFGKWPVEKTDNNLQGFAYATGLFKKFPWLRAVRIHFLLPYQVEGEFTEANVKPFTVHLGDIPKYLLRIQTAVARAKNASAQANPNAYTCRFCSKKGNCDALHKFALKVSEKYAPLQVPDVINPSLVATAKPADLARGLEFFSIMEGLAKGYKAAVNTRVQTEEDLQVPGYALVVQTKRSVEDAFTVGQVVEKAGFLSKEDIYKCSSVTLGAVEKLVSSRAPRGQKKLAVEKLAEVLEAAGATKKGTPIVFLRACNETASIDA